MTQYTSWFVGMPVECIDDDFDESGRNGLGRACETVPVRGEVYTIREIGNFYPRDPAAIVVLLVEITNPTLPYGYDGRIIRCERSFAVRRFRPVQERKTSIEIFQRLLLNPNKPIRETV